LQFSSLGKVDKSPKEKLLQLLRDCAWAEGVDDVNIDEQYKNAVKRLKDSLIWKKQNNFEDWLATTWLCIPQVCVYLTS